jgi:hypothetical protein
MGVRRVYSSSVLAEDYLIMGAEDWGKSLHGNIFHFLASLALVGTTVPMTLVGKS